MRIVIKIKLKEVTPEVLVEQKRRITTRFIQFIRSFFISSFFLQLDVVITCVVGLVETLAWVSCGVGFVRFLLKGISQYVDIKQQQPIHSFHVTTLTVKGTYLLLHIRSLLPFRSLLPSLLHHSSFRPFFLRNA